MGADLRLWTCAAAVLVASATAPVAEGAPALADDCPVTRPGRVVPPLDVLAAVREHRIFGSGEGGELMLGRPDGALWASALPPDGVVRAVPVDDELGLKLGWWKRRLGTLHVEGRRLDAPAPPARFRPQDSYSAGFLPSGLTFPTEGCWEVIGRLGPSNYALSDTTAEELRFVLRVVRSAGDRLPAAGGFPVPGRWWAAVLGLALVGAGLMLGSRR